MTREIVTSENKAEHDAKKLGLNDDKHHHQILERLGKNVPEDVENAAFGHEGYVYHTPYRPIENSQQTSLGTKITPIHERAFSSDKPISAEKINKIEAKPISENAIKHFAKELADAGVHGMMHKSGGKFSVALESAKGKGKHQVTEYDKSGAIGDSQHNDKAEAIHRMIEHGYTKILPQEKIGTLIQKVMIK
jgi:hypothetical protein